MKRTKIETELLAKYSKLPSCIDNGWLSFLRCAYEVASERKQYQRCYDIAGLIAEEINADSEYYDHTQID